MTQEEIRLTESSQRTNHWMRWGPTSANAPGARYARTTARAETPGNFFPHDHTRSRVYHGEDVKECFFYLDSTPTALREWAYVRHYLNSEERDQQLSPWLEHYNFHRPHGSLGSAPPISRAVPAGTTF